MSKKKKIEEFDEDDFDENEFDPIEDDEVEEEIVPKAAKKKPLKEPPPARKIPPVEIVFQDENLMVINKPSGLDSNRGQFAVECVLDVLEAKLKDLPGPLRLVHRLDRDTSGLMLLAKTPEAQRNLSTQWETRSVEKTYLVIVHGVMQPREGVIDLPLKKTENNYRPVLIDHEKGKTAVTEYKVLDQFRQYALLEAHPVTGRMHQIRVHVAAHGCPVLCDPRYGSPDPLLLSGFKRRYKPPGRKEDEKERPLIARLALHANSLKFNHPVTNERMEFKVEPPKDFSATVKQLGKYGR
jgi:23S rRNA pseudouridine1911/1915/1917 synthase